MCGLRIRNRTAGTGIRSLSKWYKSGYFPWDTLVVCGRELKQRQITHEETTRLYPELPPDKKLDVSFNRSIHHILSQQRFTSWALGEIFWIPEIGNLGEGTFSE